MTPLGQFKTHWKEVPNWTLREESFYVQVSRGHKCTGRPALIYTAKKWPYLTMRFTDSIAKKPNLVVYEDVDMLEYCHTLAKLQKHFCYSRHYEVQLSLEHDLSSNHPQDLVYYNLEGSQKPHTGSKGHKLQQTYRLTFFLFTASFLTQIWTFRAWYQTRLGFVKLIAH